MQFLCSRCGAPAPDKHQTINVWLGPFGRIAAEFTHFCDPCALAFRDWFAAGKAKDNPGDKLS